MRVVRTLTLAAAWTVVAATQSGCLVVAAAAATGGVVAYAKGDTEAVVAGNAQAVTAAGRAAVEDLGMTVVSSNASTLDGQVVARTAKDKRVKVTVRALGEDSSRVAVRVGTFGNESLQMQVLDRIKQKLAGDPPKLVEQSYPATQAISAAAH